MKNVLLPIFSPFFERKKLSGNKFQRFKVSFDNYCGSYKVSSETPERLLKTQTFEKKGNLCGEKKSSASFLSYYPRLQTSGNTFFGHTNFLDKHCLSYTIIYLGPKKSNLKFFKKRQSSR